VAERTGALQVHAVELPGVRCPTGFPGLGVLAHTLESTRGEANARGRGGGSVEGIGVEGIGGHCDGGEAAPEGAAVSLPQSPIEIEVEACRRIL